jgi:soluble lytic murein transglycosylase-like protein
MHAKSIVEYACARFAEGAWAKPLSFVPVAMALAVAALPFTLTSQQGPAATPAASATDAGEGQSSTGSNLMRTAAQPSRVALPDDKRHALLAEYMARKYYVSRQVVQELVKTAYVVGRQYNVDPTLLVAVIAVESSFNPIAESVAGAKGLMQIIPKFHQEKFVEFGGEHAVFDPHANIAVGAKIIREYLQASSGNLAAALQTYAGALPDRDASYTHKVLNEKDRLDAILGLPKTERPRSEPAPAGAQEAPAVEPPKERVKIMLPAPTASLPAPIAALRLP